MKNLTFTILTLLVFYSFSNAAIVYTDIDPDKVLVQDYLEIDLDGDGTKDVSITNWSDLSNSKAYAKLIFLNNEVEIVGDVATERTEGIVDKFDLNSSILSSHNFIKLDPRVNSGVAGIAITNAVGSDYTPWIGQTEKYVGFRIKKNNLYHYGWIELSFSSDYILTIHGYAYEGVASTPIKAGDDGSGSSSNNAPTDIALNNNSIDENTFNSVIGDFSTTDTDAKDIHIHSLISGTGDDDNTSFTIIGNNSLQSTEVFDFESKSSYSIRVKTDDGNGGTFEKQFTITINDINDNPLYLKLVNSDGEVDDSIDEGEAVGSIVAYIEVADDDEDDVHTISFVDGEKSDDNDQFTIEDYAIKSNTVFDYETKSSYTVRVKIDDGNGGTLEQPISIYINDISNASSDLITKQAIQVFPNPASSTLHVQGIRPNSTIQLISPIGAVVYKEKKKSSDTIINISEFPSGAYWLNISDSNKTVTTRMITIE